MNDSQNPNDCSVALDLPYPPVQAECRSTEYANAMLSNIGSDNSEISAVSLYFYNSVILKTEYAEFAHCFHSISIAEMHHLDIFASLAWQMGLDPRLWYLKNNRTYYWTPAYNYYPQKICDVIENAIRGEQAAIQKYTRQAAVIKDSNVVENLNRIILDEQHHIKIFRSMMEKLA